VLTDTPLPLRIPRAFREKYGYKTKRGYITIPIFAEKPMWRWAPGQDRAGPRC